MYNNYFEMNAILNFKEQSMPKFSTHASSKREKFKAPMTTYDPHLPLISKYLLNY